MAYRIEASDTETISAAGTTFAVSHGTHASGDLIFDTVWVQSASSSPTSLGAATGTLSAGADTFTYTGGDYFDDGIQVQFTGTLGSLTAGTHYFVRDLNTGAKTFKLALTSGGSAIDITGSPGSATAHRMTGGASANNNCVGWNIEPDQALATNTRGVIAWVIATSSSMPTPTFTNTTSVTWHAFSQVIRDVPSSNPIDGSKRTNYASVTSGDSGSLTTTTDDCLLIYNTGSNAGGQGKIDNNDAICINTSIENNNDQYQLIGYRQFGVAGSVPVVKTYFSASTNIQTWVVAIKNGTNGTLQPWCTSGLTELVWYGAKGSPLGTVTWETPEKFSLATAGAFVVGMEYSIVSTGGGSTDFTLIGSANNTVGTIFTATGAGTGTGTASRTIIGSISRILGTASVTVANNSDALNWGGDTSLATNENFASPGSKWVGACHQLAFPDLTGKLFSFEWRCNNSNNGTQWGPDGHLIGFSDANGNFVLYQVYAWTKWTTGIGQRITIEIGVTTPYVTSGSIDWTAVTRVGLFMHRLANQSGSTGVFIKNAVLLGTAVITGGGEDYPATFYDAHKAYTSCGTYLVSTLQGGKSQVSTLASIQIGDGTLKTYFDSSAQAIAFPLPYDTAVQKNWRVSANNLTLGILAKSTDTINLASGASVANQEENLTIDASSDTGATYSFAGQSFVGWAPTWKTGVPCSNVTFKLCDTVAFKGANPTSVSISKTTSTTAACSFDANDATMTNSEIVIADTSVSTAYHISLGASVTNITLNGVTLTGTPDNPDNDKIYSELASGVLTITLDGTGTVITADDVEFIGGSTATVEIASPEVNQKVTVSGITTGARVQIYDTTSSTELFNGTSSSGDTVVSGSTVVWTDPAVATADRAIRVRVSYVNGVTAKNFIETSGLTCGQLESTAEITYPVTPTDDVVYNANGENGSTIYSGGEINFIDASPDRIEMEISSGEISLKEMYAAWVYYAFTSAGIATDIDYINAIDTANYEFTNIRWKNTSSPTVPLKIVDGYAWDSSTLDPITLVDTSGGTMFLTPAHVVAYQTTGTYAITGDISEIPDKVQQGMDAQGYTESLANDLLTVPLFIGLK